MHRADERAVIPNSLKCLETGERADQEEDEMSVQVAIESPPAPLAMDAPRGTPAPQAMDAPRGTPAPLAMDAPRGTPAPLAMDAPRGTPAPQTIDAPRETGELVSA